MTERELEERLDEYELKTLAGLISQMGVDYFAAEPARLQEQLARLIVGEDRGYATPAQREAFYQGLTSCGWAPETIEVLRQRAQQSQRIVCQALCETIGDLTEADVRLLLALAAKKAVEVEEFHARYGST